MVLYGMMSYECFIGKDRVRKDKRELRDRMKRWVDERMWSGAIRWIKGEMEMVGVEEG